MMHDSMPPRVAAVQPYVKEYWEYMINGTGDQYYLYPENDTIVNVFDYKQCVEVRTEHKLLDKHALYPDILITFHILYKFYISCAFLA